MEDNTKYIYVATFGKVHGVDGNIILKSFCDPPENIFTYSPPLLCIKKNIASYKPSILSESQYFENTTRPIRIVRKNNMLGGKVRGKNIFIVHIAGVGTPTQLTWFVSADVYIKREQLQAIDSGYYWCDLLGMQVVFIGNKNYPTQKYGKITKISSIGNNDLMHIKNNYGNDIIIPFIENTIVIQVDMNNGIIHVDWPPDYIV